MRHISNVSREWAELLLEERYRQWVNYPSFKYTHETDYYGGVIESWRVGGSTKILLDNEQDERKNCQEQQPEVLLLDYIMAESD